MFFIVFPCFSFVFPYCPLNFLVFPLFFLFFFCFLYVISVFFSFLFLFSWFFFLSFFLCFRDRPKFSSFLSPATFFSSWIFGGVLEGQGPEMCGFRAAGASHDSPRTPNVHIRGSRHFKTPPKFHEKTPKEGRKNENCDGRGKKKREILAGLHSDALFIQTKRLKHQFGQSWFGQSRLQLKSASADEQGMDRKMPMHSQLFDQIERSSSFRPFVLHLLHIPVPGLIRALLISRSRFLSATLSLNVVPSCLLRPRFSP